MAKKPGPRSDYPKHRQRVKASVSSGASTSEVAEKLDVSRSTAHRWMRKARRELPDFDE